jgi:glycerol-3-phosphate acyltransferase PlsY
MIYALLAAGSYFVGGIPFGYILAKLRGVDVRREGSRNIGATNVFRTAGAPLGILTLVLDGAKGFLPAFLALRSLGIPAALLAGVSAMLGHAFSPYLRFRGGKGVATGLGMFLVLSPPGVLVGAACFILVVLVGGYVSLGSILGSLAFVIYLAASRVQPLVLLISALAFVLVVFQHRGNIRRLIRGEERKIRLWRAR